MPSKTKYKTVSSHPVIEQGRKTDPTVATVILLIIVGGIFLGLWLTGVR